MQRLQCGFKKVADVDSFFRGGNLKKGECLLPHVYGVEQIVGGDVTVKAKCVSELSNKIYDIELEIQVGCTYTCNGVRTTSSANECIIMSSTGLKKMQPRLHYMCKLGTCSNNVCVTSDLQVECWLDSYNDMYNRHKSS
ncbi:uncharacterized protein LOC125944018 [Dermacentor silvarum]|uniref:uncharacterized protein LOC125944018 n=1 Tax=Dermacentor silvarum TaxID=543639 RepID=UPI0021019E80|nr:uncharacterized protein LOC125944018 [Dermacentor silvarum]